MLKSEVSRNELLVKAAFGALLISALLLYVTPAAAAATGGSEFKSLYDLVSGWATGYLGRAIAVSFLIIGLIMGVIRGSVIAAVTAIVAAVCLVLTPAIVDGLFTGTVG